MTAETSTKTTLWQRIKGHPKVGLILLAYIAFIALGMPDGLLGVAWPSIRTSFGVPLDALAILLPVVTAGYLTSSFFSGPITSRWGVGRVLAASCFLTGIGLIGYTLVPVYGMMVALGVLAGLGAGAIDSALNTYVAAHFGEGLMQWLHACYGIGITSGPIIMTMAISNWDNWRTGYRIVGGFQLVLTICFFLTLPMWSKDKTSSEADTTKRLTDYRTPMLESLKQGHVWLSALLFFLYVGGEVSLGTWAYSLLTASRGVDPTLAGLFTGSYWAMFTVGRILAGLYAKKVGVHMLVQGSIGITLLGALLLIWNPSPIINLVAVGLIGLAIAPIFPALMSGTTQRVRHRDAANTIGLQMAASGLGTAVLPGLLGILARQFSLEIIPVCLLVIYLGLFLVYRLAKENNKPSTQV